MSHTVDIIQTVALPGDKSGLSAMHIALYGNGGVVQMTPLVPNVLKPESVFLARDKFLSWLELYVPLHEHDQLITQFGEATQRVFEEYGGEELWVGINMAILAFKDGTTYLFDFQPTAPER